MFTLEESALLSRFLRVTAWALLCLIIGAAFLFRSSLSSSLAAARSLIGASVAQESQPSRVDVPADK